MQKHHRREQGLRQAEVDETSVANGSTRGEEQLLSGLMNASGDPDDLRPRRGPKVRPFLDRLERLLGEL